MNPLYARQLIHTDTMTVARAFMKKGCEVPEHSHPNEQVSMIEKGALQFTMDGVAKIARPGDVVRIASNLRHSAVAVEDSIMVEIFSPPRSEWIKPAK